MKVIIWSASYLPVLGGVQTVTSNIASQLQKDGHEVLIWTKKYPRKLAAKEKIDGINVLRFPHTPLIHSWPIHSEKLNWLFKTLWAYFIRLRLNRIIRDFKPDVLNIHFPDAQNFLFPFLKLPAHCRIMTSIHGHEVLRYFEAKEEMVLEDKKKLNKAEKRTRNELKTLLEASNIIYACSKWMVGKTEHLFEGGAKLNVAALPNFVDAQRFEKPLVQTSNSEQKYIFAFGRLEVHKGFDQLIKAFKVFTTLNQKGFLYIAGSGTKKVALLTLTNKLNIEHRVVFLGKLDPKPLAEVISNASLIVIPSKREPFGISVIEAVASNKPFVASNIGGIPEASGNFGLLYDPEIREEELAEILDREFDKEVTAEERYERKTFLRNYSLQAYMGKYYDLIKLKNASK